MTDHRDDDTQFWEDPTDRADDSERPRRATRGAGFDRTRAAHDRAPAAIAGDTAHAPSSSGPGPTTSSTSRPSADDRRRATTGRRVDHWLETEPGASAGARRRSPCCSASVPSPRVGRADDPGRPRPARGRRRRAARRRRRPSPPPSPRRCSTAPAATTITVAVTAAGRRSRQRRAASPATPTTTRSTTPSAAAMRSRRGASPRAPARTPSSPTTSGTASRRPPGASVDEWLAANNATADTPLYVGDELCIPAGATAPEPRRPPRPRRRPRRPAATAAADPAPDSRPSRRRRRRPHRGAARSRRRPGRRPPPAPRRTDPRRRAVDRGAVRRDADEQRQPRRHAGPAEVEAIIREIWPDDLEVRALCIAKREANLRADLNNWCCYGVFALYFDYVADDLRAHVRHRRAGRPVRRPDEHRPRLPDVPARRLGPLVADRPRRG